MVLSIVVPHFPALGSGGVPPVPPTILMSVRACILYFGILYPNMLRIQGVSTVSYVCWVGWI